VKVLVLALLCPLTLLPGCRGSAATPEAQRSGPVTPGCALSARPPSGYVEVAHEEVSHGGVNGDVNGLRTIFKGRDGQHLVYTSGVLMDLYESAPVADGLKLVAGGTAALFDHGKGRWILYWTQNDACHQYTVGGDGFSRAAFMQLLYDIGVLQPPDQ
jgi:hypothetical protein